MSSAAPDPTPATDASHPDRNARPHPADPALVIRPRRPARQQFGAVVLQLEAFLVLFATLVAFGLRVADPVAVWTVGGALAVVLLLLSGLLRSPGGYLAGSVVQVLVVASGVLVPMMYALGGIFVVLWVVALRLGSRIDRERAEFDATNPDAVPPAPAPRR